MLPKTQHIINSTSPYSQISPIRLLPSRLTVSSTGATTSKQLLIKADSPRILATDSDRQQTGQHGRIRSRPNLRHYLWNHQPVRNSIFSNHRQYNLIVGYSYADLQPVGMGAFGLVWYVCICQLLWCYRNRWNWHNRSSAKDQLTGQAVAVKKIMKPFSTPVLSKRTYRELKLLKHLKHENARLTLALRNQLGWLFTRSSVLVTFSSHRSKICRTSIAYTHVLGRVLTLTSYFVTELLGTDLHRLLTSRPLEKQFIQYFLYQILVWTSQ